MIYLLSDFLVFMSSVVGLPEDWYLALRDLGGQTLYHKRCRCSRILYLEMIGVEKYVG
ncbi:hypothetical protein DKAM_0943 [Desulfurococcus amylolyticus 1221n]|uniref:Uncharacterized protein n=1 Tax=Desulfurococcus amylolyticus (strain DSM 18924 / JCM 16383 / VKM B-2413 / 1221n) TaxID=490899 RepID=B8D588_DESA1|nr:hypothetical protein DKAM_0943 [Desulfurococcus amylolyticus 1221n]